MTRGFITVATGSDSYYIQARNLLHSFKLFNQESPFAIICDRKNKYTEEFDDVVIIDNPKFDYLDKFRILKDCPYDENIFIETDCLVYHNLEHFWGLLSREYDLTSFGWNDSKLSRWFPDEEYASEKFLKGQKTIPTFNPGYLFIRKGKNAQKMFSDAMKIIDLVENDKYCSYQEDGSLDGTLYVNRKLRDDPIFFMIMALNNCLCTERPKAGKCIFLPSVKKIKKISFSEGRLELISDREYNECNILHFSSRRAREEGLYLQQVLVLNMIINRKSKFLVKLFESKVVLFICNIYMKLKTFLKRKR